MVLGAKLFNRPVISVILGKEQTEEPKGGKKDYEELQARLSYLENKIKKMKVETKKTIKGDDEGKNDSDTSSAKKCAYKRSISSTKPGSIKKDVPKRDEIKVKGKQDDGKIKKEETEVMLLDKEIVCGTYEVSKKNVLNVKTIKSNTQKKAEVTQSLKEKSASCSQLEVIKGSIDIDIKNSPEGNLSPLVIQEPVITLEKSENLVGKRDLPLIENKEEESTIEIPESDMKAIVVLEQDVKCEIANQVDRKVNKNNQSETVDPLKQTPSSDSETLAIFIEKLNSSEDKVHKNYLIMHCNNCGNLSMAKILETTKTEDDLIRRIIGAQSGIPVDLKDGHP